MAVELRKRLITVADYYRMGKAGVFRPDERVELIEGEIIEMTPIGRRHAATVSKINNLFSDKLQKIAILGIQNPIDLGETSEPEPDVVLLRPRDDFYADHHPRPDEIFLLIEVADTSFKYDQEIKLPLYAKANISEVWIVNLEANQIETYCSPKDGDYQSMKIHKKDQVFSPLHFAECELRVSDLLP